MAGRAVDLVGEEEVREDGPRLDVERALVRAVDARPDEVGRHEVRRELDALEGAAEHFGEGLDRQRLGQARHALEEEVAAGQEADEDPLEHRVLADDDPPDLEQDGLGGGARVGRIGEGAQVGGGRMGRLGRVGHVGSPEVEGPGVVPEVVASTFAEIPEGSLRTLGRQANVSKSSVRRHACRPAALGASPGPRVGQDVERFLGLACRRRIPAGRRAEAPGPERRLDLAVASDRSPLDTDHQHHQHHAAAGDEERGDEVQSEELVRESMGVRHALSARRGADEIGGEADRDRLFPDERDEPAADEAEPRDGDHEEPAGLRLDPVERVLDHARHLDQVPERDERVDECPHRRPRRDPAAKRRDIGDDPRQPPGEQDERRDREPEAESGQTGQPFGPDRELALVDRAAGDEHRELAAEPLEVGKAGDGDRKPDRGDRQDQADRRDGEQAGAPVARNGAVDDRRLDAHVRPDAACRLLRCLALVATLVSLAIERVAVRTEPDIGHRSRPSRVLNARSLP